MSVRILIDTLGRHYVSRAKDRSCAHCGGRVNQRGSSAKFCSRQCFYSSRLGSFPNRKSKVRQGKTLRCGVCETPFYRKPSAIRSSGAFCSRQCANLFNLRRFSDRTKVSPTSLERLLYAALNEARVPFRPQHVVAGFVVDAFIPSQNIAIEVDGEYWHSRPENVQRDRRKDAALRDLGITVARITEKQATADIGAAVEACLCR